MEQEKIVRVGVFCDLENSRYSMENNGGGSFDIEKYVNLITKFIKTLGSSEIQKFVYGCFDVKFFNHRSLYNVEILKKNNFCIQNVPLKKNGKDRSDMHIATDICTHLFKLDDIDHYVIFSGDSDFSYLLQTIKLNNKKVSIMSLGGSLADELKIYANEVIVINPDELNEKHSAVIIQSAKNSLEEKLKEWRFFVKIVIDFHNFFKEKNGNEGFLALSHFKERYQKDQLISENQFNTLINKAEEENLIIIQKKETLHTVNLVSCIEPNMENKIVIIINQELINN